MKIETKDDSILFMPDMDADIFLLGKLCYSIDMELKYSYGVLDSDARLYEVKIKKEDLIKILNQL